MKPVFLVIALPLLSGCAAGGSLDSSREGGSRGLTQSGAQDIGYFRAVVDTGEVPAPELLDQVGFFAEHALDQPPADCGASVCAHPSLAVAPRFDERTWTMAFVSLNSLVDPETRPREPVHVVMSVERSTATAELLGADGSVLEAMLSELEPDDRVSLVAFGAGAEILFERMSPVEAVELGTRLPPSVSGDVDLYAGIAAAAETLARTSDFAGSSRVVLLTSGAASGGLGDAARIEELSEAIVRGGASFSVVGMGDAYAPDLPQRIADLGAGSYAFAENAADLADILEQEGGLRMLPLATDVELRIAPSAGYTVGRLYGARRATVEDGVAVLRVPALFLGARTGSNDVGMGRRGGGGGLFVELLTDHTNSDFPANEAAFVLEMTYLDADTGERVTFEHDVVNDLRPGKRPDELWPHFSHPDYAKAFMMLNMYLALKATLDLYAAGDCGAAMGIASMMEVTITEWQHRYADPDIEADAVLLFALRDNIRPRCRSLPVPPSNFQAGCFFT